MTLSDALTHRDEPSAVLDAMSHVDQSEMNVSRPTRIEIVIRETVEKGEGRDRYRDKERERERERGNEGEIVINAFLCPATFSEEHSSCMRKRRP